MKVTKLSIHRLTITKDCGCSATREYEDIRYTKPLAEGVFAPCEKHEKNKMVAEFAGEMLLEALNKEAETAGKNATNFVSQRRDVAEGDSAGVQATSDGGTVQALGVVMPPKIREKRDPLAAKTASVNRPTGHLPTNTDLRPLGNLNIADISPEELEAEGITMDGSIEGVPADPKVDQSMQNGMATLEEIFDDDDSKTGGVSQTLINRQAVD